jgi:hypothetical protein
MFTKCCAAWLIVLAISPFTAPFIVCQSSFAIGQTVDGDRMPANDLEEWFVNGGAMLDFPVAPVARELKLASLATLSTADFVEMAWTAPLDAPPVPTILVGRAPTLAVLRL